MNLKTKLGAAGATLATTAALGLLPAAAASAAPSTAAPATAAQSAAPAATTQGATIAPATLTQNLGALGTFNGLFTPTGFTNQNGQLAVTGVVTGTVTSLTGAVTQVPAQTVTTTVQNAATAGSCSVLKLDLGPLHLNLLGLVVDLNAIHLDITAQQGPGNLLGNLLCAVAGLLDGNGVTGLAGLLNQLLGL